MYGSPSGIYLRWESVPDAKGYEVCGKVGFHGCRENDDGWKPGVERQLVYFDKFYTPPQTTYTYRIRAIDSNGLKGELSEPRRTTIMQIWPVTKLPGPDGCTAEESLEVSMGYNQFYLARFYVLHQALDLTGEKDTEGECVRAPMGGEIQAPDASGTIANHVPQQYDENGVPLKNNRSVGLKIILNNQPDILGFGHLEHVNKNLKHGYSVESGTWLGNITSTYYDQKENKPENNHTHFTWGYQNPLALWNTPEYRDPFGNTPEVIDSNKNDYKVRFRQGPNEQNYLFDNGKVYGPADIVVEARDAQSSYEPWQAPLKVGYYIQHGEGENIVNVVRSAEEPYVLIDSRNKFFGDADGMRYTTAGRIETLFDANRNLQLNAEDHTRSYPLWFTYIVTNTTGTEGTPEPWPPINVGPRTLIKMNSRRIVRMATGTIIKRPKPIRMPCSRTESIKSVSAWKIMCIPTRRGMSRITWRRSWWITLRPTSRRSS